MPVAIKKYKFYTKKTNFIGFIIKLKYIIIIIHFIYSPMRFPYRSIQTVLTIIRKILLCPFGGKNLASV